ncbi:DUF2946 family protein [Methyloversatilis sp. RAC08]|uniref:DUF2946 family protein n=1 Tax=Methyloversatilis sp. RAC08 TaxID=1842540 RepID=UPI00083D2728|nr:DUF2946 family protein [Methyloversatilis sp. RAC08]
MSRYARPPRTARRLKLAWVLLCAFVLQFVMASLGGAVRVATPFDEICSVSAAGAGDVRGGSGDTVLHGQHCALCVPAGALPPPPLPFPLTQSGQSDAPIVRIIDTGHWIETGAHWQPRAPPLLS